jgi:hypothetical protein
VILFGHCKLLANSQRPVEIFREMTWWIVECSGDIVRDVPSCGEILATIHHQSLERQLARSVSKLDTYLDASRVHHYHTSRESKRQSEDIVDR